MNILVVAGGISDERAVSLRSGGYVVQSLKLAGHSVTLFDPGNTQISLSEATEDCDVVFSALHGSGGEDGTMQSQLDRIKIPYVGSDVDTSMLCFDKWNYRSLLQSHNLPVAEGELVDLDMFWKSKLVQKPFVLKPPKGGSSIDTLIIRSIYDIDKAKVEQVFTKNRQMLLEELIEGVEITVGILGNEALPVIEIIPPAGAEFDYTNKYNGSSQELCPPKNVSKRVQTLAQQLALHIHELTGCRDFSRTDMIVDANSSLIVLETNTIPGLTEQSLFPKAASVAGISMPVLCDQLIHMALKHQIADS